MNLNQPDWNEHMNGVRENWGFPSTMVNSILRGNTISPATPWNQTLVLS